MTSSARDLRYGRRGGAWAETRTGDGVCHTCRNADARYEATHQERHEQWPICERCAGQARRYSVPITLTPLMRSEAEEVDRDH